jgi:hypothetical protein
MRSLIAMNPPQETNLMRQGGRTLQGVVGERSLPGVLPALEPIGVPIANAAGYEDQRKAEQAPSAFDTKRKLQTR